MADVPSWQRGSMKKGGPADPCCTQSAGASMHPKISRAVNMMEPDADDRGGKRDFDADDTRMANGGMVGKKMKNCYADGGTIGEKISGFFSNPDTSPVFGGMRGGDNATGPNAMDIATEKTRKEDAASKVRDSDEGHTGFGEGSKTTKITATVTAPEPKVITVDAPAEGAVTRTPAPAPAPAAPAPRATPKPALNTTTPAEDARESKRNTATPPMSRGQKAASTFGSSLSKIGQGQIDAARFFKPLKTDYK